MIDLSVPKEHQIPQLSSERILLRACRKEDYASIKRYRQNPAECKYIRLPDSDEQTIKLVEQFCLPWQLAMGYWNAIIICPAGDDKQVAGEAVFSVEDDTHRRIELGYRIDSAHAGKGLATEAMELLIDYLVAKTNVNKLVAKCDPRNLPSIRIMQKLGMKKEAHFSEHYLNGDEWTDQLDYGISASRWRLR